MKNLRITFFVILLMILIFTPVLADSNKRYLQEVGYTTSITYTNAVYGNNTLYNTEGTTIRIYNITQPGVDFRNLTVADAVTIMEFSSTPVAPVFDYRKELMFLGSSHGFTIYSVRDPLHPSIIGIYNNSSSDYQGGKGFFVIGDYLYRDWGNDNWHFVGVFDISDPANPFLVKKVYRSTEILPGGFFTKNGNYLYQGFGGNYYGQNAVIVYDVSEPSNPVQVARWRFNQTSVGAKVPQLSGLNPVFESYNNTLYIAHYGGFVNGVFDAAVIAVNITDPYNPVMIGALSYYHSDTPTEKKHYWFNVGNGGELVGNYLYVGERYGTMLVYNVSVPGRDPFIGANHNSLGYTEQVSCTKDNHYCFIATNTAGTAIIDVTDKTFPKKIGTINVATSTRDLTSGMVGSKRILGATGRNAGNTFWDVSDPENWTPRKAAAATFNPTETNPRSSAIAMAGNYSYSVAGGNGPYFFIQNLTGFDTVLPNKSYKVPYKYINYYAQGAFTNEAGTQLYVTEFGYPHVGKPDNNWTFVLYNVTTDAQKWNPVVTGHFKISDVIINATLNPILNDYPDIGTCGGKTHAKNIVGIFADCGCGITCSWYNTVGVTIPYNSTYLIYIPGGDGMNLNDKNSRLRGVTAGLGLWFINIANESNPWVEKTYGFGNHSFGEMSSFDATSKLFYVLMDGKLTVLNLSNLDNIEKLGQMSHPSGSGSFIPGMARNGTDLYVPLATSSGYPDYLCIDASNPYNLREFDRGNYYSDSGGGGLYYNDGYVYAGTVFKIIAYKVYPSSSAPPIVPPDNLRQTISSENQQQEQQSESSLIDQIINQLSVLWKSLLNI